MWEKIEGGYIISASLTLRESGKCSTHVGGDGADDKILLFLKFCQRIYKKWNFSGKKSLKNVKNRENQEKSLQKWDFADFFSKFIRKSLLRRAFDKFRHGF